MGIIPTGTIADSKIPELEQGIRGLCETDVLYISPAKYNDLYERIGNLNRLLAWAHGKVIENLLTRGLDPEITWVLIDRFASEG